MTVPWEQKAQKTTTIQRWQGKESFFILFFSQNNKNSLTKTSFSLRFGLVFTAEDETNTQSCPSHLLLAPFPPRLSLPSPRGFLTGELQGLLLCLRRGIQAITWLVTLLFWADITDFAWGTHFVLFVLFRVAPDYTRLHRGNVEKTTIMWWRTHTLTWMT